LKSNDLNLICEIGGNHHGSLEEALRLIDAAAESGATHVKFQCFTPEQMVGDPAYVLDDGPWKGRKLLDLYTETHTPREWFPSLFDYARLRDLVPFASVFHQDDVDFLEGLDCELYKISSFEMVDLELIEYAAGKQVLISTGGATDEELEAAWQAGSDDVVMMACTSAYPADPADANLGEWIYGWDWGLSDHTLGCGVAAAAVALGATWIEKHFTLDRKGPDGGFSMLPDEFRQMAEACQQARAAIGCGYYAEKSSLNLRRSLWWAADLEPGQIVGRHHLKVARPADGLPPSEINNVLGKIIIVPVHAGNPVSQTSRHYE